MGYVGGMKRARRFRNVYAAYASLKVNSSVYSKLRARYPSSQPRRERMAGARSRPEPGLCCQ
ncbi:hypothetical protein IG631_06645 [Alternaria alternata]|nr:hypothetical protein IG631_06645 [Alternaria alternata]